MSNETFEEFLYRLRLPALIMNGTSFWLSAWGGAKLPSSDALPTASPGLPGHFEWPQLTSVPGMDTCE